NYEEEWYTYNPRWIIQFGGDNYNYDTRGAEAKSYAAYSQITWTPNILNNKLELTAGIRWTKDEKDSTRLQQSLSRFLVDPTNPNACVCLRDASGTPLTHSGAPAATAIPGGAIGPTDLIGISTDDSWSKVTPMAVASYHITDEISTYAKFSTGYKSGGINGVAESNAAFREHFDQETMRSYEIGLKSRFLDNRVQLNSAVFYNEYDDIQVNTFVPAVIGIAVNNAGKAAISGLEMELVARPTHNLDLSFNYAYLDTKYKEYMDLDSNTGQIRDFSSERQFAYSPRHSFNTSAKYTFDPMAYGTLSARVDYVWTDEQFIGVNNDPTTNIDDYGLLGARITLADIPHGARGDGQLSVSLWGKNLTDEEYTTSGVNLQVFSVNQWGDPRSYGAELTYRF
ncbi:MAG: TonB-dependent receptor, partial [Spongiibacteraceae bacterium]|nr:TonB-dependent receptor [Spongiibacteraceae bacterium]